MMDEVSVDGDDVKSNNISGGHLYNVTNLHHDLEKLQQSHDELLHQVEAEKALVGKLKSQLEETRYSNDGLTKQLECKEIELKEARESIDCLRQQVTELQENGTKVDRIKMLAVKLKKDLASTKDELERSRSSESQAKEQLKAIQKDHDRITSLYQQAVRNFQTLQDGYDRLQDEFDQCKAGVKSVNSDLNSSVTELGKVKEELAQKMLDNDNLTAKVNNLMGIVSEYDVKCKELESSVIVLRSELAEERKKTVAGIGLEKSLEEFKHQLDIKTNLILELEDQLEQFKEKEASFESLKPEYDAVLNDRQTLGNQVSLLKVNIGELERRIESVTSCLEEEKIKSSQLTAEKTNLTSKLKAVEEESLRRIKSLQEKMNSLEESLSLSEDELKRKDEEFEAYKLRVCKVLNQNKQGNVDSDEIKSLREKLAQMEQEKQEAKQNYDNLVEEKTLLELELRRIVKENGEAYKELKKIDQLNEDNQKLKTLARDLQNRLVIERENYEKDAKKIEQDNNLVIQALRQEISDLKTKITCLEDELTALQEQQQQNETSSICQSCKNLASLTGINLQESPILSNCDYSNHDLDHNHHNHNHDISRESIGTNSPTTLGRRARLSSCSSSVHSHVNPLQEILNSRDDDSLRRSDGSQHHDDSDQQQEFRRQIIDLTQLLKESESNNALLVEQNRVLKEEIRRIQRSIERADLVQNMEYLKNILVKFVSCSNDRSQLIPVLKTILKLSKQEEEVFVNFANLSNQINSKVSKGTTDNHHQSQGQGSPQQNQGNWSSYLWQTFS